MHSHPHSISASDCCCGVQSAGNVFLCRDPNEPVAAFLARLVPTQTTATQGAWIYTDNPTSESSPVPTPEPNWQQAVHAATHILATLTPPLAAAPTQTRQRQLRQSTTLALKHVATLHNATIGKWILFYPHSQIDLAWSRIATATARGTLGVAAKVNTTTPAHADGSRTYVICVYTPDFNDRADVRRVLVGLYRLGLTPAGLVLHDEERSVDHLLPSATCTWKPDLYTLLGIEAGNQWGLAPTLYRWQEFIPPKSAVTTKKRGSGSSHAEEEHAAGSSPKRSKTDARVVMVEGVDF